MSPWKDLDTGSWESALAYYLPFQSFTDACLYQKAKGSTVKNI